MKYKLGIITPCHINEYRHDISLACFTSLLNCRFPFSVVHILVNDCSVGKGDSLICEYAEAASRKENFRITTLRYLKRMSKWHLSKSFRTGIKASEDCEYLMSIPDDVLLNPYIFEVIEKSLHLLDKFNGLTYFKDTRGDMWNLNRDHRKAYNEYYEHAGMCDGFQLVCKRDFFDKMIEPYEEEECRKLGKTMVWNPANKLFLKGRILQYKESLSQHIGNPFSAMTKDARKPDRLIYAYDVNLWNKPEILNG